MRRGFAVVAVVVIVAGCFEAGALGGADTDAGGATGDIADADVGDTAGPCGGCPADTPVCVAETGMCVECLDADDCSGETSVCDRSANACVACTAERREEWYVDGDGDGFGDPSSEPTTACQKPDGKVQRGGDCDEGDETVHPEADETCDGRDEDCDGTGDAEDEVVAGDCADQQGVCRSRPKPDSCP
ncbi:MAG: putative metal-binding motif-containing protein, partial [Bradymonadaceae bacterium]